MSKISDQVSRILKRNTGQVDTNADTQNNRYYISRKPGSQEDGWKHWNSGWKISRIRPKVTCLVEHRGTQSGMKINESTKTEGNTKTGRKHTTAGSYKKKTKTHK